MANRRRLDCDYETFWAKAVRQAVWELSSRCNTTAASAGDSPLVASHLDVQNRSSDSPTGDSRTARSLTVPNLIVRSTGDTMTLSLTGRLDVEAGRLLALAVAGATASDVHRVVIDIRLVTDYTSAGAAALIGCRSAAKRLPGGLIVRGSSRDRNLLLAVCRPAD